MTLTTAIVAASRLPAIRRSVGGGTCPHHRRLLSSFSTTLPSSSSLLTSTGSSTTTTGGGGAAALNIDNWTTRTATRNSRPYHRQCYKPASSINHYKLFSTSSADDNNKSDDDEKKEDTKTIVEEAEEDVDVTVGKKESMEFQAETKQLLDIVTNSLYSEKEVFLRELVSNASDSLEKLRQLQLTTESSQIVDNEVPLEIRIDVDETTSTITISDTGIGMTKDDMISNLGTIAKSGSRQFVQELERHVEEGSTSLDKSPDLDLARGIIGKFGVGFYSVFMVARKVEVRSKPALIKTDDSDSDSDSYVWTSDGTGTFDIAKLSPDIRQDRGTSIVIHLHSDFWHLCNENKLTELLKTYSNFVAFPIVVHGNRVNTIQAVWAQDPKEVPYETHVDFYKYIANAIDDPIDYIHFRADAPLDIKAVLYIPSFHSEKYGMGRMEPGVSLYCRKVLIESKCKDIVPDWMRFVKGVVDSEDLPLAISREKPQEAALLTKLRSVMTRKFLAHLEKMAKKDRDNYIEQFYREYSFFLKEGVCHDYGFQPQLAKLLYFETNKNVRTQLSSFDEYISNMRPEQNDIYYLCAPSREAAAMSPYLEAFEQANVEVIFIYSAIDDFVMANLDQYEGRKLMSVEKGDIDLSVFQKSSDDKKDDDDDSKDKEGKDDDDSKTDHKLSLDDTQAMDFCLWMQSALGDEKVSTCRPSTRLVNSPAIVTDNESGAMRRMMRLVDTSGDSGLSRESMPLPKQNVEINPSHPIIVGLNEIREKEPVLARVLAEQIYDNCLVAAGLLDDSRTMLPRLNDLLIALVKGAQTDADDKSTDDKTSNDESKE